ncbi:MAG: ABC transporter ATP-binding protein [Rubrobacter sp.]|jgi:peptide/nickel transport system ATP-binding protein|nr:ABC transporter ATP-binding protein [Rubrobacter sp.]
MSVLLEVRDLDAVYHTPEGPVRAVDGVDLTVGRGEVLGIVGESGSGKTTLAMSLMRLIKPPGRILGGSVMLDGEDLFRLRRSQMPARRGRDLALIPQSAMHALNPVIPVDRQVAEAITAHQTGRKANRKSALHAARERLEEVGIPPERHRAYPHELSGGMRQRCVVAMAVANRPKLIIADEPVSGLDVVVQARILRLISTLRESHGLSMILVSHDLPTVARVCDRIAVMYAGRIVEVGGSGAVFENPLHPYTRALVEAIPRMHSPGQTPQPIPGDPPDLHDLPSGCNFRPRCPRAFSDCAEVDPSLEEVEPGRRAACLLHKDERR